jgi:MarR family transcriptional regulator for hemolysin
VKFFPLDESPGFWVYRAHTQGNNLFRKMLQTAGYDLTPEQCGVLLRLREFQGMNQSQLGKRLFKDRHNITRILNLLEGRGFIQRRPDGADKRIYRIFLTEAGMALGNGLAPLVERYFDYVLQGLTDEDITVMQRTLGQIVRNIERNE